MASQETAVCSECGESKDADTIDRFRRCDHCNERVACAWSSDCKGDPRFMITFREEDGAGYCRDHRHQSKTRTCEGQYGGCERKVLMSTDAEAEAGGHFCEDCRPEAVAVAQKFDTTVRKLARVVGVGQIALGDVALCQKCPHPRLSDRTGDAKGIRDTGWCPGCQRLYADEFKRHQRRRRTQPCAECGHTVTTPPDHARDCSKWQPF